MLCQVLLEQLQANQRMFISLKDEIKHFLGFNGNTALG